MRTRLKVTAVVTAVCLCGATAAWAGGQAASAKPRVVQGTTQLAGEQGKLGITYTIGKSGPINFTLRSAEYTVGRVSTGEHRILPSAQEKTLVLHFTVQNPQKQEFHYNWGILAFTAVDAKNVNREFTQYVASEKDGGEVGINLKPAQKLDCYTTILVPAQGVIPKLIVKSTDDLVVRYDLKGKVKPLAAPFADRADKSGATALAEVPAQQNVYYPTGLFDMKVTGFSYTSSAINGEDPPEGGRYLVVTMAVTNQEATEQHLNWGQLLPEVTTADGERLEWNSVLLLKSRDAEVGQNLRPKEELQVRLYFAVPEGAEAKTFRLRENEEGRAYLYDLTPAPSGSAAAPAPVEPRPAPEDESEE